MLHSNYAIWAELAWMASEDDALIPCSKRAKSSSTCDQLLEIEDRFCEELGKIDYGESVSYVYNPLEYASEPHRDFVRKYGNGKKKILFLGMNPGPFGMAQNGVCWYVCCESVTLVSRDILPPGSFWRSQGG